MTVFKSFLKNSSGNIAFTAALLMVPMLAAAGIAIDYSAINQERAQFQQFVDAAILAGTKETRQLLAEGTAKGKAIKDGETLASDVFNVNALGSGLKVTGKFVPNITVNSGAVEGTAEYTGLKMTRILGLIGFEEVELDIAGSVAISPPDFAEIFFVIDNSPSMGVGATAADITTLENAVSCAFACHAPSNAAVLPSNMTDARASGATLKIDVVRNAIASVLDELEKRDVGTTVEVGLFTFSNTLTELSAPTTNYTDIRNVLSNIDLVGVDGEGGTSYDYVMQQLEGEVGTSGTGTSQQDPKRVVVLLTDGVSSNVKYEAGSLDYYGNPDDVVPDPNFVPYNTALGDGSDQWHIQGFNPNACERLKNIHQVEMYVINTDYVTSFGIVNDDNRIRLDAIINGVSPFIETELGKCASGPENLYNAKDGPAILDAFDNIVDDILKEDLRVTG